MTGRQCFDIDNQAEGNKKHKKQVKVKESSFLFGKRDRSESSGHWVTSSFFNQLGTKSKSLSSLHSGNSRRSKLPKKSKTNVSFSGEISTRTSVTKTFSEIERIRSLEQPFTRTSGNRGFWVESSFLQKSKSLSSLYFDRRNDSIFDKFPFDSNKNTRPFPFTEPRSSKVFSGVDFGLNKSPSDHQSISESIASKFWAATDLVFPSTENQTLPLTTAVPNNSTTPLLLPKSNEKTADNKGEKVPNNYRNLTYDSFTTTQVLSSEVLEHPLQLSPEPKESILFEDNLFSGNEPYLDLSTSRIRAKSANDSFCSSYQSDLSEIFFPHEDDLKTQNRSSANHTRPSRTHNLFSTSSILSSRTINTGNYNNLMVEKDSVVSPTDIHQFLQVDTFTEGSGISSPSDSDILESQTISNQQHQMNRVISTESPSSAQSPTHMSHTTSMVLGTCIRCLNSILYMKTAADCLCFPFDVITTNPKVSFISVFAFWIVINLIILPFRFIVAFIMKESLLYISMFGGIIGMGRFIIRMIAFPGSNFRVYGEVEKEFTKYSLKMLDSGTSSLSELAAVILSMSQESNNSNEEWKKNNFDLSSTRFKPSDLIPVYERTKSYRDRVLGLYLDILNCIFDENGDGLEKMDVNEDSSLLTNYGNNKLVGDVGKISTVSNEAKAEGKVLHNLLKEVLNDLRELEEAASNVLNSSLKMLTKREPSSKAKKAATKLLLSSSKFKELLSSMKATSEKMAQTLGLEDCSENIEENVEDNSTSSSIGNSEDGIINVVKSSARALIPILDPPPHYSIFGLDVLRGCMLSRYVGARQLWVKRPDGGMLDVIHIPCRSNTCCGNERQKKAVLYCNPNAGLTECATGMSLIGGNVGKKENFEDTCWADFYICNGFDIYLFNYAGFGRSSGYSSDTRNHYRYGIFARILRLFNRSLFHFKPTPYSMKSDALSLASYIVGDIGVDKLVVHGESIGGMAAASAARKLSELNICGNMSLGTKNFPSLLLCDRTFCNLPAVAQRLVGGWAGHAIRFLVPMWSTDVAGDFINALCPKVVAQDSSDAVIHDAGSLKSGLAIAQERLKGNTKNVGLKEEAPVEYRMAEWENVGVSKSSIVPTLASFSIQGPCWPSDKHITIREAFHFAACAKRIGKMATTLKKGKNCKAQSSNTCSAYSDEEQGIEISVFKHSKSSESKNEKELFEKKRKDLIMKAWRTLACCDGMTGMHCGAAVKQGYDCTVTWLYSTVAFGGQVVASAARTRNNDSNCNVMSIDDKLEVSICDFGIVKESLYLEDEITASPIPIPEVTTRLKKIMEENKFLGDVEAELRYCITVLEYIQNRLMSKQCRDESLEALKLMKKDDASVGCFLNLECGHNNQYSYKEKEKLVSFLTELSHIS